MGVVFTNGELQNGFVRNNRGIFTNSASYQDLSVPTWADRVILNVDAFSCSSGVNMTVQLISANGVRTTGYYGAGWYNNGSQGIHQANNDSVLKVPMGWDGHTMFGQLVVDRMENTNLYIITGTFGDMSSTLHAGYAGRCDLGATMNGIRLGWAGGTIDSGSYQLNFTGK